jgi:hypothetical protein
MQMEVAVFDFPQWDGPEDHVPLLAVDWIAGADQAAVARR